MAATYMSVEESEIKTIIWHDMESSGMPIPIAIFPPTIPNEAVNAVCKTLNELDPTGKYAEETDKYVEANAAPGELDDILGEVQVESAEPASPSEPSTPAEPTTGNTGEPIESPGV